MQSTALLIVFGEYVVYWEVAALLNSLTRPVSPALSFVLNAFEQFIQFIVGRGCLGLLSGHLELQFVSKSEENKCEVIEKQDNKELACLLRTLWLVCSRGLPIRPGISVLSQPIRALRAP